MGKIVNSGPLVFDTRSMGRRPGTERTFSPVVEAPADLGFDVIGVVEGSPVSLELRLECVMDGVLATGTARSVVVGECVRCLEPLEMDLELDFQELYVYNDPAEDELAVEDDLVDLEPVLRDAVVLALPHNPLCGPECPGLCPECGARLADNPDHAHGDAIDPRWSTLTELHIATPVDLPEE
jgi:uncharacterized protein